MKKSLLLIASAAMLFTACSKESSDPVTPTPVTGDGSGKFAFSMDTSIYRVDTLTISYRGRDGQVQSQTLLNTNSWSSPDLTFKTGDSLRAEVKAVGELKKTSGSVAGVTFTNNPTTTPVPTIQGTSGTNSTTVLNTTRFQHSSSRLNRY